ncbi:MAG TPA: prolyl oligopeptidase family serine peptidase [Actinomycetota bacterium]|nr:prolyl oligopeptidase family serine peptidase [Actinomycetota bacterium]
MPRDNDPPLWERRFLAPTRTFPVWSRRAPDRAVYLSDEEGSFQAYAWDLVADTHRRLSDETVGVDLATISTDGSEAIWFSDPTGDESGRWIARSFDGGGEWRDLLPGAPIGWPDGLAIGRRLVGGVIADRDGFAVYVSEDGGPAKEIHRDVDALSIAATDFHLEGFDLAGLSADDQLLCVEAAQDGDSIHRLLRVLDPRTGRVVAELADGEGFGLSAFAWSPVEGDQRLLAAHEREDLMRPTIWDPTTGDRIDLEVDLPGEVIPVDWFPAADAILVAHLFRGRDTAYRLELATGTLTEIVHPRGELHGARVRPDGRVWVRVSTSDRASRVLDDAGAHVLAEPEGGVRDGRPYRDWVFANPEGGTLHGWIALPDGEPPFPTYLKVHGGPSWLYLDTWWPDVQMLLDLGFAVGMVNYRGSTGYGRRHRDHIIRNVGFPEVADTVAGLDDLIARGIADPDRAVIGGWSWGGYTTLLALGTRPGRFAAGVAGVPVGDYMGSYDDSAPSLQAYDRSLVGGVVHDVPEFVAERSPITYVDRVDAPVLVLVGENDTRCVPGQVYAYVDALKAAGGEVELYSYGEGHSSFIVEEELRQWRVVVDFLERTVLRRG